MTGCTTLLVIVGTVISPVIGVAKPHKPASSLPMKWTPQAHHENGGDSRGPIGGPGQREPWKQPTTWETGDAGLSCSGNHTNTYNACSPLQIQP